LNRKGVTIVELLIYIVIFAIALFFIGKQMQNLIGNYSSNKRVVQQQTDARDILGLMIQDIRNTGLKTYLQTSGTSLLFKEAPGTIVGTGTPIDSSSFVHKQGTPYDEITVYKIRLDNSGNYALTDTTRYYVEGTTLKRTYRSSASRPDSNIVAQNVYALQFQYGVLASTASPINQPTLNSPSTTTWESGGSPSPTYSSTSISLSFSGTSSGWLRCRTALSVTANQEYRVKFYSTTSGNFPQNLNWVQCAFMNSSRTQTYGSEKFKPWANPMEITLPVNTSSSANGAYLCLDYSSSGDGSLLISGLEVTCTKIDNYNWTYAPTSGTDQLTKKANVRAIRMYMLTRTADKAATKSSGTCTVGEVSVTTSGNYTWRLYTEMVETPNNGTF
jgi:type II secretory pathway component PulJ